MTAVDALLLLAMLALMVSGIMLSNHVFAFLDLHGGLSFARLLHMAGSYWAFVLTALHLGLHWAMILQRLGRALHRGQAGKTCRTLLRLAGAAVAVYGLTAFFRRGLPTYLFVQRHFVFFDFRRTDCTVLSGLSGHDGRICVSRPLCGTAAAKNIGKTKKRPLSGRISNAQGRAALAGQSLRIL